MEEALGAEKVFLEAIFPGMQALFPTERLPSDQSLSSLEFDAFGNMADKEWRFERFRLAFRGLLRCVSTHVSLVLLIDDLHWIDLDSFSVIRIVLDDAHPGRKFLFVGASRLTGSFHCLHELQTSPLKSKVDFIKLPCLSEEDIADLLADLLHREREDVVVLADILHEKTSGNSFVVLQLLRMLEQNGLIYYDPHKAQWQWDRDRIIHEGSISDDITEVIAENLKTLVDHQKRALAIAAIFRVSHFDVKTIVHAMTFLGDDRNVPVDCERHVHVSTDPAIVAENVRKLNEHLRLAAQEGLVRETSPGHYKFAHDRIREAAYKLASAKRFCM